MSEGLEGVDQNEATEARFQALERRLTVFEASMEARFNALVATMDARHHAMVAKLRSLEAVVASNRVLIQQLVNKEAERERQSERKADASTAEPRRRVRPRSPLHPRVSPE